MAQFIILCTDKPDSLAVRTAHRPDHVAYLGSRADVLRLAGPVLDDQGQMAGSMLIVETPDRAGAEAFAAGDPFAKAGLFAAVRILPWRCTIGPLAA